MSESISDAAMDQLFRDARSHNGWLDKPVAQELLTALYDLMKMGPTSANCSPLRIVFITSKAEKERLKPAIAEGNLAKTMTAPVVAILGSDQTFYEKLPILFPHDLTASSWFAGKPAKIEETAFRNSSLQGAYFMLAARAVGLDCGPMSGFDPEAVDALFFSDSAVKSNFICNLGYGDASKIFERSPRLPFDQACRVC